MKDSQDWLDIEEILDNLWYEAAHDAEPIGSAVAKAKQAIKAHIKQEMLALLPKRGFLGDDDFSIGYDSAVGDIRIKIEDNYKEV